MSRVARALAGLLAIGLAGCTSSSHPNVAHVPDWEEGNALSARNTPSASNGFQVHSQSTPPFSSQTTSTVTFTRSSAESWIPLARWAHENTWANIVSLGTASAPSFAVHSSNGVLVLSAGNVVAHWNGIDLHLGFAPQMINEEPFIHAVDLNKTILPLLKTPPEVSGPDNPVIVIDPGHGGENAGAKSVLNEQYEKEFTLDWALRLQKLLAARGCRVWLTRSNDMDLAISNRVAFAGSHKADLFLSLHFNSAAPNQNEAGLETYCLTPPGMPSSITRGYMDQTDAVFPNNAFDEQNLLFATRIHGALLQVNGHLDRGVRRARFLGVLRGQQCPAILIEAGYLSNREEARLIAEADYRQKLAEAVAGVLLNSPSHEGLNSGPSPGGTHRVTRIEGQELKNSQAE